jgi:hypothetical protein
MSADFMMRSVATMACAFTLSLFTTIAAYATVNVAAAKTGGPSCSMAKCASALAVASTVAAKPTRLAKATGSTL